MRWLLASGGDFPKLPIAAEPSRKPSPRRRGINQGIMLLLFASIIVPVIGINGNVKDGGTAAIFFFGIALARIIYAMLMQSDGSSPRLAAAPVYAPPAVARAAAGEPQRAPALPASTAARFNPVAPQRTTAELVPPPSVTDHTTRLLEAQEPEVGSRKI